MLIDEVIIEMLLLTDSTGVNPVHSATHLKSKASL